MDGEKASPGEKDSIYWDKTWGKWAKSSKWGKIISAVFCAKSK